MAVLIDYTGPGMQPDQLRRQTEQVDQVSGQHIIDTESNFGKVALGHYRQVIAFYTQGTTPVQAINLQLGKVNGTQQTLAFKQLPVTQRPLQETAINQQSTVKAIHGGKITGRLTTIQQAPEALVAHGLEAVAQLFAHGKVDIRFPADAVACAAVMAAVAGINDYCVETAAVGDVSGAQNRVNDFVQVHIGNHQPLGGMVSHRIGQHELHVLRRLPQIND